MIYLRISKPPGLSKRAHPSISNLLSVSQSPQVVDLSVSLHVLQRASTFPSPDIFPPATSPSSGVASNASSSCCSSCWLTLMGYPWASSRLCLAGSASLPAAVFPCTRDISYPIRSDGLDGACTHRDGVGCPLASRSIVPSVLPCICDCQPISGVSERTRGSSYLRRKR